MSSANPMSSISSASSSTRTVTCDRSSVPRPMMIERAAGRRDDDVDAALEDAQLLLNGLPAVDPATRSATLFATVSMDGFGDLHGELARGHKNQTPEWSGACRTPCRCAAAAGGRRPRSFPCRSPPAPGRRGRRAGGEWPRVEWRSVPRSRAMPRPTTSALGRGRGSKMAVASAADLSYCPMYRWRSYRRCSKCCVRAIHPHSLTSSQPNGAVLITGPGRLGRSRPVVRITLVEPLFSRTGVLHLVRQPAQPDDRRAALSSW